MRQIIDVVIIRTLVWALDFVMFFFIDVNICTIVKVVSQSYIALLFNRYINTDIWLALVECVVWGSGNITHKQTVI